MSPSRLAIAALAAALSPALLAQTLTLPERKFPLEACLQKALAQYPGKVKAAELEVEGGVPHYEFLIETLVDGETWEVECNANTGAITNAERDVKRDDPAFTQVAKIDVRKALDIALAKYPGMPTEVEYEVSPNGRAWYEITVVQSSGKSIEVMVDAATGAILGAEDESDEMEIFRIGDD